jgi:hypothetical protein
LRPELLQSWPVALLVLIKEIDLLEHRYGLLDMGLKVSPHDIEHLD